MTTGHQVEWHDHRTALLAPLTPPQGPRMRALWFAAGTAAGVYATAKVRRAAEAMTVDGIHDRLTGWFAGARVLGEELRSGTQEKETELRSRLALVPDEDQDADNVRQLAGHRQRAVTDDTEKTGKGDS